jgi:Kdo2-lipid IVA lauroyltransferase/acyltransferase
MAKAQTVRRLLWLSSLLPLWLAHSVGSFIGLLLWLRPNKSKHIAQMNIDFCFPQWSAKARRRLLRQGLQEMGKAALEAGALWLWPLKRTTRLVREVRGRDLLDQAVAQGRGVIIAGPHLGAWELAGLYVSTFLPLTSLYRPPKLTEMDSLIRESRQRGGACLVPTDASGVRALMKALQRGELVGILPDQDPERESGVFAPFFGMQTHTMVLVSRLARKSGATVLFCFAERLAWGRGYILHFKPAPQGIADQDLVVAATALNQGVEQCVLEAPAQYQWTYKRFKSRPPGEAEFY